MRMLGLILGVMTTISLTSLAAAQAKIGILDLKAMPLTDTAALKAYQDGFLVFPTNRAFAISSNGKFGIIGNANTIEAAREAAVKSCVSKGGEACAIYAENLDVVWPGRKPTARAATPDRLITIEHSDLAPDQRFLWYGPKQARGILVFGHGYGGAAQDARMTQPPAWTRVFNNNGYDVVRFARDPAWDGQRDLVAQWLRTGLAELRKAGWKHIVVAGQSRGSYNAFQVLDTPGLADVVISGAAAAYGQGPGNNRTLADLWTMFGAAASPLTRVAFIQFDGDDFNPDPAARTVLINDRLKPRVGPILMIDRPKGFTGHGAQTNRAFVDHFGGCLWRFATDPSPPSAC